MARVCSWNFSYKLVYEIKFYEPIRGHHVYKEDGNLRKMIFYILRSDTTSQIAPFSSESFLHHYGGQLKTAVEKETAEKIDCKR